MTQQKQLGQPMCRRDTAVAV